MKDFIRKHRAFLTYLIVGFMATLLNTFSFWLFYERLRIFSNHSTFFDLSNVLSTIFSWIITIIFAFFTNKIFVYKARSWNIRNVLKEAFGFLLCRSLSELFDIAFMYITVSMLEWNSVYMKFIAALIVGLINYLGGKLVIFKSKNSHSS